MDSELTPNPQSGTGDVPAYERGYLAGQRAERLALREGEVEAHRRVRAARQMVAAAVFGGVAGLAGLAVAAWVIYHQISRGDGRLRAVDFAGCLLFALTIAGMGVLVIELERRRSHQREQQETSRRDRSRA